MAYQKNDLVELLITDMGEGGEGIGKAEGYTVFVKDAVIGDRILAKIIKAKKTYGYGRLMDVLEASPDRVEPACPNARACGGCQLQALSYEKQLAYKQEKVKSDLERIGGCVDVPMLPIVGMEEPWRYRNKAQFPIGTDREGNLIAGFYAGRTHSIIPCIDCALGAEGNKVILEIILDWMKQNRITAYNEETGKGLMRHVLIRKGRKTGQWMVCLVINGKKVPHAESLVTALCGMEGMTSITFSPNQERTNVIMGKTSELLWGQMYITDYLGDIAYQISPLSFYQVNPVQTEKLYNIALEYADLKGKETVWDLYCGIGTISLFLAQKAKEVHGVEIIPQAIEDAKKNAALNHMTNAEFTVGKAEEVLPAYYESYAKEHPGEHAHADVIVVDPPRKGCDPALLDTILKMQPDRVVYVSCDPSTLARDVKILREGGYQLQKVQAVDQFPHTVHVETCVLLTKASR